MSDTFLKFSQKKQDGVKSLTREERLKNLQGTVNLIQKKHGDEAIQIMNDDVREFPHISTGIYSLDKALGIGGFPRGRMVELYGTESSGKSSLALNIAGNAQKNDGMAALIDMEHSYVPKYAKILGVNTDELLISQPNSAEEALGVVESLIDSQSVDVIIVDSVAALVPQQEIDKEMGESNMGVTARLLGQACRKLTPKLSKTGTVLIWINQTRDNLTGYGGVVTPGGKAIKFFSSVRCEMRKVDSVPTGIREDTDDKLLGIRSKVKIVKNKVAPPFKSAEFDQLYATGYDRIGSVVDGAIEEGIIEKGGAWFTMPDGNKLQGKPNVIEFYKENEKEFNKLKDKLTGVGEVKPKRETKSKKDEETK